MLDVPSYVKNAENQLKALGVPIEEVLRRASIDRSTWTGWKNRKIEPRLSTLRRAEAEITKALATPHQYQPERAA